MEQRQLKKNKSQNNNVNVDIERPQYLTGLHTIILHQRHYFDSCEIQIGETTQKHNLSQGTQFSYAH